MSEPYWSALGGVPSPPAYIGSTILAARATSMTFDPFPTTYTRILAFIYAWVAPSANNDITDLTWKPLPDPGSMHQALTGTGQSAPTWTPGANPVPLGRVMYHTIYQNAAQLVAKLDFFPGWQDATKRHGIHQEATSIQGVAGTNADIDQLCGLIMSPGSGGSQTLKAITGMIVNASRNLEVGSRIDVFGM